MEENKIIFNRNTIEQHSHRVEEIYSIVEEIRLKNEGLNNIKKLLDLQEESEELCVGINEFITNAVKPLKQ